MRNHSISSTPITLIRLPSNTASQISPHVRCPSHILYPEPLGHTFPASSSRHAQLDYRNPNHPLQHRTARLSGEPLVTRPTNRAADDSPSAVSARLRPVPSRRLSQCFVIPCHSPHRLIHPYKQMPTPFIHSTFAHSKPLAVSTIVRHRYTSSPDPPVRPHAILCCSVLHALTCRGMPRQASPSHPAHHGYLFKFSCQI